MTYISLAREFQRNISDPIQAHVLLDTGKDINVPVNRSVLSVIIMSKTANMCDTCQFKYNVQNLTE